MAKGQCRIYWRQQGGQRRAYADLRPEGRGQVPLRAEGERYATTDEATAAFLFAAMLRKIEEEKRGAVMKIDARVVSLHGLADAHLVKKAETGAFSSSHLAETEKRLGVAVAFFRRVARREAGDEAMQDRFAALVKRHGDVPVHAVTTPDVYAFASHVAGLPNGRGGKMGPGTQRAYLAALSNLFRRAESEGIIPAGSNPVRAMMDRPAVPKSTTPLREPWELALLLESARTLDPSALGLTGARQPLACAFELLAFMLYTGTREDEARTADVRHLHFMGPRGPWIEVYGTKTDTAERVVPMHPHLAEILTPYLRRLGRIAGPLFMGRGGEPVGIWTKTLDLIATRAGYAPGEIRTRQFRTAYASHRATCDGVDANTVRLECGWTDLTMMARVYARAQRRSDRMGAEFSYRLDRWAACIEPARLAALAAPVATPKREERAGSGAGLPARRGGALGACGGSGERGARRGGEPAPRRNAGRREGAEPGADAHVPGSARGASGRRVRGVTAGGSCY